jgi:hypothetical protein
MSSTAQPDRPPRRRAGWRTLTVLGLLAVGLDVFAFFAAGNALTFSPVPSDEQQNWFLVLLGCAVATVLVAVAYWLSGCRLAAVLLAVAAVLMVGGFFIWMFTPPLVVGAVLVSVVARPAEARLTYRCFRPVIATSTMFAT